MQKWEPNVEIEPLVVTTQIHDLVPSRYEILRETFCGTIAGIDFSHGAKLRV
jgi:hypothetical protein